MAGGTRFKLWMQKAGADLVSPELLAELTSRFLNEAANDSGGERVYVPVNVSEGNSSVRSALKLSDEGFTFDEIDKMLDGAVNRRTFYRWKRDRFDFGAIKKAKVDAYRSAGRAREFVYALGFQGVEPADRCVKIGMSVAPELRAATLQRESSLLLTDYAILGINSDPTSNPYYMGMSYVERECHKRLDYCRVEGEWFRPNDWMDEAVTVLDEVAQNLLSAYSLHRG